MARNIVICCDGTGKQYGRNNTNVVRTYQLARKDPATQVVYYDPGIGTFVPRFLERQFRFSEKPGEWLSKAFGFGLRENLNDAYTFLMDTYEAGDRLYLFGFSRGAFTVRCLAGLLKRCGLLEKRNHNLVPYALRQYFRVWSGSRPQEEKVVEGFKRTFSRECAPHFVGVWDTVNSYGLLTGARFPNRVLDPRIKTGVQALSIDERRVKFTPSPWEEPAEGQTVRQVWFAGVHSDVGGGYPPDESGLAQVALLWLLEQAEAEGLLLREGWRSEIEPDPCGRMHDEARKLRWKILGGTAARTLPKDAAIHDSVRQRMEKMSGYRPTNLPG